MTENENPAESPTSPSAPPPPIPPGQPAVPQEPETDNNARTFGMLCHLCALASFLGIPFGNIVGPLVIWLIKKNDFPFVDEQGKEALNFQITVTIAILVCVPLIFVIIGILLAAAVGVASLVFVIIAAIKANGGEHYRYPISIRFIK